MLFRSVLGVNLNGVVNGLQVFLEHIKQHGQGGHIVNTASMAGHLAVPGLGVYNASKFAVVAISETLANDLSGSRIGISVLCPSHHEQTGIFENSARYRPQAFGGPMTDAEIRATFGRTDEQREEALGPRRRQERFPDECAARVVRAIRDRQFYIFTHPETRAAVEHRFVQMFAGFDDSDSFTG